MVLHTRAEGYMCWLDQISDPLCTLPYGSDSHMRNVALTRARNAGATYLCMLNTDVEPESGLLIQLMKHETPITVPRIASEQPLSKPAFKWDVGLQYLQWCDFSFILFRVNSLVALGAAPWAGCLTEGEFFDRCWLYGHRPQMDTATVLSVASPAGFPGSKSWDKFWPWMKQVDRQRRLPPDMTWEGEPYMPFTDEEWQSIEVEALA